MRPELEVMVAKAKQLPPEQLPKLIGELEEAKSTVMAFLVTPAPVHSQGDRLLGIKEACEKLAMSEDYLYRHSDAFPFTRRQGRSLRFSQLGIEKYIRAVTTY